jgi:Tol biopolymer transport system component
MRLLPANIQLPQTEKSLVPPGFRPGSRTLVNTRALTNKDQHGELMAPRFSPDGLSILVTRPGFQGLYILDIATGELTKLSDDNGYRAFWTKDGKVAVPSEHGTRLFEADGSPSTEALPPDPPRAWADNNLIYVAGPNGQQIPITGTDDNYYNPVVSPDGQWVAFQGLVNGIFIAPIDGSAPAQWVGQGTNPAWAPDSQNFIFDQTTDDGHNLQTGDLILVNLPNQEISNLTVDQTDITYMPQIGPDGRTILYEVEGTIHVGTLQ